MKSRIAQQIHQRGHDLGTDNSRGVASPLLRLSASRSAEIAIADARRVPVIPRSYEDDVVQDPDTGAFYFMVGHSAFGTDVLR
jgi:hypothetical protein